eukprot:CAMPEP_0197036898 /NCGR_PEP_ID=MMETSP1384-20130603/14253_1 /TAXON_ID=29189 /ORGANISM="Ammonia sp." /LENGTH=661 /DNA_ID=CAMNT_0042467125 /DNA_START=100 /DNA_END=2082 /DNA_ORIENTATION=-
MNDEPLDHSIGDTIRELSKPNCGLIKWVKNEQNAPQYTLIQNKLMKIKQHRDGQRAIIKSRYPYCYIAPSQSVEELQRIDSPRLTTFDFDYRLYIHHQHEVYFTTFTASYTQIKNLHKVALRTMIHFPSTISTRYKYPTVHRDVHRDHRTDELKEDMEAEEQFMHIEPKLNCKGPGRTLFGARVARQRDVDYLADVLCRVFNSPSFAIQGWIWDALQLREHNDDEKKEDEHIDVGGNNNNNQANPEQAEDDEDEQKHADDLERKYIGNRLRLLLQHKAYRRIKKWRHYLKNYAFRSYEKQPFKTSHEQSQENVVWDIRDRNERLPEELMNSTYHSVAVVSTKVHNFGGKVGDHWAVFFEGKHYLLFMEYVQKPDNNQGFVQFRFFPNNIAGQRRTLLSGVCQEIERTVLHEEVEYAEKELLSQQPEEAEERTLRQTGVVSVFGAFGVLLDQKVEILHDDDNCQHFARNLFAAMDATEAKFLNIQMDQRKIVAISPAMPIVDAAKEGITMARFLDDIEGYDDRADEQQRANVNDRHDEFAVIMEKMQKTVYVDTDDEEEPAIKYRRKRSVTVIGRKSTDLQVFGDRKDLAENDVDDEKAAKQMLQQFGIPEKHIDAIIPKLKSVQNLHPESWVDFYDEEGLLMQLGFHQIQARKFMRKYAQW